MVKYNCRLFYFVLIILLFSFKSFADDLKIENNFVTLGSNSATVEIKVYSSLTCPHCANFHINVVPKIKKEYIESGKAQIIFFSNII